MVSDEYAAGFFDGEGSVYANLRKRDQGRNRSPTILICISNTNREVLEAHKDRWGGSIAERKIVKANHRRQYQWVLSSRPARDFLNSVLPYLIIKKEVASVVLNYLAHLQDTPHSERIDSTGRVFERGRYWVRNKTRPEFQAKTDQFYWKIRELNKRGAPFNVTRKAA